jgi:hypothetical protein
MVEAVRRGEALRAVARRFAVSLFQVQFWVERATGRRLDRVDWSDRPAGCRSPANRVTVETEDRVLALRQELKQTSDLGEFGAAAIRREWSLRGLSESPSLRTIGRILERRGALDGRRRQRRPAPQPGWYLPAVACAEAELDSFDIVEGLVIRGGTGVEVLNGISLHGSLVASWPRGEMSAKTTLHCLIEHWRQFGLPAFAQFDNDTRFHGTHRHPDSIGRVMRLCLSLGVTPVFVPPREHGFQAMIENYNGRWQTKVWSRFQHESLAGLQQQSQRFVTALRGRLASRSDAAPRRRPFPHGWKLDLQATLRGRIIFLRRTNDRGAALLLGHTIEVDCRWVRRLVRVEVDLDTNHAHCYALRRREPQQQPLLCSVPFAVSRKRFQE